MDLEWEDFNGADTILSGRRAPEWAELEHCLRAIPLHLKPSDQAGLARRPNFDPIGTNAAIIQGLGPSWHRIPIPPAYRHFGLHIDNGRPGVVVEIQFSNYPFVINNVVRADVLFRDRVLLVPAIAPPALPPAGTAMEVAIVVTKAHMFPASNSTLYYEAALRQVADLTRIGLQVPLRVVGLTVPQGIPVPARWTEYLGRTSRTVQTTRLTTAVVGPARLPDGRCPVVVR